MCRPRVLWDNAGTRPQRDARLWRDQSWAQWGEVLGRGRGSEALGPAGACAQQGEFEAGRGGRDGQEMAGRPRRQGPCVVCCGRKVAAEDQGSSIPKAQRAKGAAGLCSTIPDPHRLLQLLAEPGPSTARSQLAAPKATPQDTFWGSSVPSCHAQVQALCCAGAGHGLGAPNLHGDAVRESPRHPAVPPAP